MIQTGFESRVKIQQIIDSQLPEFMLDESPKASEFLKQYYISQEYQGGPVDIAENLDQYLKLDNLTPEVIVGSTRLTNNISNSSGIAITVTSTKGFPQKYGLIKIDNEIITYTGITTNTFAGCIRGFSGITSYHTTSNQEELGFSTSTSIEHASGSSVQNLSSLFLKEFYKKLKYTLTPGLEDVDFVSDLNVGNFIKNAIYFYQSKGTDESYRILFNVLYGITPKVVNLENFLIKPSSAQYVRRTVVPTETISGDPSKLVGQTIFKSTDPTTSASVSEVEIFTKDTTKYYKISLFIGYDDRSVIEGNFTITQNTKCLENVSIGSSIISVDSTIGFEESGTIVSGNNTISYTNKTINQFLGCTGITKKINSTDNIRSDEIYFGYENGDVNKKVEFRITGALSEFIPVSQYFKVSVGDEIFIKSLGELIEDTGSSYKEIFANSWIYNTSSRYEIETFNGSKPILKSTTNKSSLKVGDIVEVVERYSNIVRYPTTISNVPYVKSIDNDLKTLELNDFSLGDWYFSSVAYDLRRKVNKAKSSIIPIEYGDDVILSDILNVYNENDDYMYVASNSFPSNNKNLSRPYTYQITANTKSQIGIGLSDKIDENYYSTINFNDSAPFISGDKVYYQPSSSVISGLETGSYYVEVQKDNKKIKLYDSRSFIGSNNYVRYLNSTFNSQNIHKFVLYSQKSETIGVQKLLKKFPLNPNIQNGTGESTQPGSIGLLINGIEIENYKSDDKVYYGPLSSVDVLNGGSNYDVINPPLVTISVGLGITALVQPVLSGNIQKVFVDSQDFDINTIVSIAVTGGNGKGAVLEPILKKRYREIYFDGRLSPAGGVNYTYETIQFLSNHNLNNGDRVIYNSNGNNEIGVGSFGGSNNDQNKTLSNNSEYYIKKESNNTIKLYPSFSEYSVGINTIGFTEVYNSGIHKFTSVSDKKTISEIKVINGGEGYQNRKLIVNPTGISTINHTINFNNHGFNEGDLIEYNYQTTAIVGLSSSYQYYISKLDDNSFRLFNAGIAGTNPSNYNRKNYIKFSSAGSGYQYFKYPNISVSVTYSRESSGDYTTIIATPVVRGSIVDTYLYESGTGYGSTVLNFYKKPLIEIKTGKESQIKPIIVNGTIDSVNLQYGGYDYYSVPDLIVTDPTNSGAGAELRPVIVSGKITSVEITNPGIGYSTSTSILVKSSGVNAFLDVRLRSLIINNNKKFGDELLVEKGNKLKYSVSGYFNTLKNSFNDFGSKHSPIIGWAYDGNPIYGPYGYKDKENSSSSPKLLKSGYGFDSINDRPSGFENGFFLEDYVYENSGDLDECNGRFGKTPEFPNGVYAYFATATLENETLVSSFPYFIGNKYRSNYITDNSNIDQSFDFNNSSLLRNTFPYKISDKYATNDFIIESNEFSNQKSIIESVKEGSVENFDILNSGSDYKINDSLEFNNTDTSGGGLIAKVSSIKGKEIVNLNTSIQTYDNVVFSWKNEREVKAYIKPYHTLSNRDYITISGLSTNLSQLNGSYQIGVTSYSSSCISSITSSTVGLSTEIYVSQLPSEPISVGSSIVIGNETLKVLEVFKNLNILKVQRSLTGISHTATTQINFLPDYFTFTNDTNYFDSYPTDKVYFNPKESIGVGTNVGITSSITFSFGVSSITRIIPTKGIYIENHPFRDNQKVVFEKLAGTTHLSISTTFNNAVNFPTSGNSQIVYIVNKNKNSIGIKTSINSAEVFFTNINDADDDEYSFSSTYDQVIGNVEKIKSTVSVSTSHNLTNGDLINLIVKPNLSVGIGTSTSIYVKRNTVDNKILINPIGFNSTGISTQTNSITINSHNLNTGDKIYYSSTDLIASGLSTGSYFVYKVDNNKIKLSETYIDSKINPPVVVSIADTGGKYQNISPINSQIKSVKNNDLVFKLSDSSLSGYKFKIYYDQEFKNEFVSTATTSGFTLIGVGTVGVSSTASLTIKYDNNLPTQLYYNLENSGYISASDKDVNNYSEILFVDSQYINGYSVFGIGTTTFNITLNKSPEKLTYSQNECNLLEYSTTSLSAKGSIDKVNIISGGTGYKKLPSLLGFNSEDGKDAYIVSKSKTIGYPKEVRIANEGFEYSCDKTLRPDAYISPLITIENSNTISKINILDGGKNYIKTPSIVIINAETGEKIDRGILEASLSGGAINSVNIIQEPKGLPSTTIKLFTTNNTNGISIEKVESSSTGIFTCRITTPPLGFSPNAIPFSIGDKVFIEGIQEESNSTGTGFNSENYNYEFFTVSDYDNSSGLLDRVTFNISELTTNTGIAKTIQDSVGNIIKYDTYPKFEVIQKISYFRNGEKIISNGIERDLIISNYENNFIKVYGTYNLSLGEIIVGKETGNIASISKIEPNLGRFKIDYAVEKQSGWTNNIGKLNEDTQSISDNDYYQNLSYTIKSSIEYEKLKGSVNNLVHISGLKNFADTEIISNGKSGISSSQYLNIVRNIIEESKVDTIHNFDLVKDIDTVNNFSKFIKLKNKKLSDYVQCISNRVLKIDDISKKFSNIDGNPSTFVNVFKYEDSNSYSDLLFKISNTSNTQIQLTELVILSSNSNNFILEQATLTGVGTGITQIYGEQLGEFSLYEDEIGENYLQFIPTNPYDYDYDIKLIRSQFNSSTTGIGSTSIGFVNLTGSITTSRSGITTSIISIPAYKFESLCANVQIIDNLTSQMNFVNVYLNYDGINNTYISEYYFDSESSTNNYSGNLIGTFGASISSGIISLNYTNNSSNLVKINSKIVGFGTTAVGEGTYRFKLPGEIDGFEQTAMYESKYLKNVSSASTTLTTLDKFNFNAIKSFVKVSIGSTSALHKILLLQDGTNFYAQQSAFLSVEGSLGIGSLGIGTFGAEYSGNNFEFKFYKDPNINSNIDVLSFNQCLYTDVNLENIPPNLSYGKVEESFEVIKYNGINANRISRLDFDLKTDNIPIFAKTFDPTSTSILNPSTGRFTIPNHFFSNTERLIYTPKSTFIGIGESAVGIGSTLNSAGIVTNRLPSELYVIRISEDTFKLSTRKDYALLGIGVTFTSYGLGNAHQLEMYHKNNKSIVTVDNIVQYPLIYTPINYTLTDNGGQINVTSTIFSLSGISSIVPRDILRVDNEYMKVISVGLGTTSIGPITNLGSFSLVEVSRGFVGSSATTHADTTGIATIYKGSYDIVGSKIFFTESPRGNPQLNIDRGNLSYETSDFSGRVFLRNDYSTNQIYDDISYKFTGIGRTFTLTVGGANTVGLGSTGGNGILFINGIFQTPTTDNNPVNNFRIIENSGISSVVFSGIQDPDNGNYVTSQFDVNQNQTPRGGIIVSLGSSLGLGYAPLVGAKILPRINGSGAITSIVSTATTGSAFSISTATYYNTTGLLDVTTTIPHKFEYTNVKQVTLIGLEFSCAAAHIGITTTIFPEGVTGIGKTFTIKAIGTTTSFTIDAGISTIPHNYVGQGTVFSFYGDLTPGSGYNGIVAIGVSVYESGHIGDTANITASVGAGGTLGFTIGAGGTGYSNPQIFVSEPSYENLNVIGVSRLGIGATTKTGIGLLLTVDVDSGITSSTGIGSTYFGVSSFKISRQGYSFNPGDIFKPVGLVTDRRLVSPISEFKLTVIDTFSDSFAAWQFGEFDFIDSIKNYQDGVRTRFPLYYNSDLLSFEKLENSTLDLNNLLFIVINGVIQDPGISYQFEGGTSFAFTAAPKSEDKIAIFFYRGTKESDSKLVLDVPETIKKGDIVQVFKRDDLKGTESQNKRTVFDLRYSDKFETNLYSDQGVDTINYKPMSWTKQKKDSFINGEIVYKSRDSIEALVYPTAKIIKDFSTTDVDIFVDNAQFFNYEDLQAPNIKFNAIIIDPNSVNTVGLTTNFKREVITNIYSVKGSSGIITGITTTSGIGVPLALKFYLNSVGTGLTSGYPIYIFNTSIGTGVTSIYTSDPSVVGVGTTFLDNIYNISAYSTISGNVGIITCNILSTTSTVGLATSGSMVGNFSWGKMSGFSRSSSPISIGVSGKIVDVGLSTFSTIRRRSTPEQGIGIRGTGALPKNGL